MSYVPDEKHCVMSSQTDLALSEFGSRRLEWEDEGEDDIETLKLHGLLVECSNGDGDGNDKNLEACGNMLKVIYRWNISTLYI